MTFGRTRPTLSLVTVWRLAASLLVLLICIPSCIASQANFNSTSALDITKKDTSRFFSGASQRFTQVKPDAPDYVVSHHAVGNGHGASSPLGANPHDNVPDPLSHLRSALDTMQAEFFEVWLGAWPATIDWTGAVIGTYISGALNTLTRTVSYNMYFSDAQSSHEVMESNLVENYINQYFSQIVAYYFNENAFAIRNEAFDDMLWVVLGWLESIKLMDKHDRLHYKSHSATFDGENPVWYGKQFEAAFAHRAHIFYDIVQRAWDDTLCGGGLTWNPRLTPYKNTITNTLFISASVGMYLYHPGDENSSPFLFQQFTGLDHGLPQARPHDPKYLEFAINGYDWLRSINLTNNQGLYVDGYHVRGWGRHGGIGTGKCDKRNEMVYTYNQGVVLSGLRGLWESTGNLTYLEDGHELVRNVITATGWSMQAESSKAEESDFQTASSWGGIGRNGILQEFCDVYGTCSQDAQTFKGIFFHHLTQFCEPLLTQDELIPGKTFVASPDDAFLHAQSCKSYGPWVARNAKAAMSTKNAKGLFGMWWGGEGSIEPVELPPGAIDIRNKPWIVDEDSSWQHPDHQQTSPDEWQRELRRRRIAGDRSVPLFVERKSQSEDEDERDYNDRGRGRTVETQGGGLMVVRALWELLSSYGA